MSWVLTVVLAAASWIIFQPSRRLGQRVERALGASSRARRFPRMTSKGGRGEALPLTVLVQQLAALLRGGRSSSRLWEELWLVHGEPDGNEGSVDEKGRSSNGPSRNASSTNTPVRRGPLGKGHGRTNGGTPGLSAGSLQVLAASRAASTMGASAAKAIRRSSRRGLLGGNQTERRIWMDLASCMDVAESSGCPLADILTRFAAQLEAEDDADDARQTALAGPKATVRLLTWLPVFGLGLGVVLGVDALGILLGSGFGMAALAAGIALAIAGRIWSARLVRTATNGG